MIFYLLIEYKMKEIEKRLDEIDNCLRTSDLLYRNKQEIIKNIWVDEYEKLQLEKSKELKDLFTNVKNDI